jgi:hypothetical protein
MFQLFCMKGFREFSKKVTMEVDFTIRLLVLEFVELVSIRYINVLSNVIY